MGKAAKLNRKQSLSYNASNFLLLQLIFVLSANLSIIFSIKHLYNNMSENSKKYRFFKFPSPNVFI